jgi:hypothetical protein
MIRRVVTALLLAFAVFSLGFFAGKETERARASGRSAPASSRTMPRQLVATWFHETKRCEKCLLIEQYGREAIVDGYPADIPSGRVVWRVLDMDLPENRTYREHYGLTGSSLILADFHDGVEADFTNVRRVWDLTDDRETFLATVREAADFYMDDDAAADDDEDADDEGA